MGSSLLLGYEAQEVAEPQRGQCAFVRRAHQLLAELGVGGSVGCGNAHFKGHEHYGGLLEQRLDLLGCVDLAYLDLMRPIYLVAEETEVQQQQQQQQQATQNNQWLVVLVVVFVVANIPELLSALNMTNKAADVSALPDQCSLPEGFSLAKDKLPNQFRKQKEQRESKSSVAVPGAAVVAAAAAAAETEAGQWMWENHHRYW